MRERPLEKVFSGRLYTAVTLVACAALTWVLQAGAASYGRITASPPTVSPYLEATPALSPGMAWAKEFTAYSLTEGWVVDEGSAPAPVTDPTGCPALGEVPDTVTSTYRASGSGVTLTTQTLQPGTASAAYSTYLQAEECFPELTHMSGTPGRAALFDKGAAMTMGDAVVLLLTSDNTQRDALADSIMQRMADSLSKSGCVNLAETDTDAARNLFTRPDGYTGLMETQTVVTGVDLGRVPAGTPMEVVEITSPGASEPEGPLPAGMPALPAAVQRPSDPQPPAPPGPFSKDVTFQVADPSGPGCGWAWSGFAAPVVDRGALAARKNAALSQAQSQVDSDAQGFLQAQVSHAGRVASTMPAVSRWNAYASEVNRVHALWAELESQREVLRPRWEAYVANHDLWRTFDARKQEASEKFQKEQDACQAAKDELSRWEQQWSRPSPSPAPTATATPSPASTPAATPSPTVPPRPAGCTVEPVRPEIMDQQKPAEPQPPTVPEGVTVPSSWPQPK